MDLPLQKPSEPSPDALAALTRRVFDLERQVAALKSLQPADPPPVPPLSFRGAAEEAAFPIHTPELIPPIAPSPKRSLENRLGSQIFNRIGVIALLIGTSLVLKLAIDQGWIGPIDRVIAGLVAGAALVLWSERFRRKNFAAFSYSLKAVGTGVLYLTLWATFHLYHLLPAPVALIAMIGVTAWNAFMAFTQDSELLAAYALTGAFATPLLLSTGGDHEIFLFTYLLAIDLATAILLIYKPWTRLILGSFPSTVLFFIGWYSQFFDRGPVPDRPLAITSGFLFAFFGAFTIPTLTILTNTTSRLTHSPLFSLASSTEEPAVSSSTPQPSSSRSAAEGPASPTPAKSGLFALIPLALIPANAAFLSLGLYSILEDTGHHSGLPWLMVIMAALSLSLMRVQHTAAAAGLQLSLAVTFLTIAIPLKATGRWITIGWLAEGVALLWTASRLSAPLDARDYPDQSPLAPYRMIRLLASAALVLGFLGAVSLPFWLYPYRLIDQALLNTRFVTSLVAIAAFAIAAYIAHHAYSSLLLSSRSAAEGPASPVQLHKSLWPTIAIASILALNLVALQSGINEIETFWNGTHPQPDAALQTALSISAYLMLYGAALLALGFWRRTAFIRWQGLILLVIAISKTFLYDVRNLSQGYRVASFMGLGVLLMAVSFAYQKDWLSLRELPPEELPTTNPEAGQ